MERIRRAAQVSVGRGVAFAAFGIVTVMVALVATPTMAARAGAILFTLTSVVLFYKALEAPRRNYRRTELWVLLEKKHGMPEPSAGRVINGVLKEVYLAHAELTAAIALLLWLLTIVSSWLLPAEP